MQLKTFFSASFGARPSLSVRAAASIALMLGQAAAVRPPSLRRMLDFKTVIVGF